jgi:transcriptional regulator with XRE-family HTH domain
MRELNNSLREELIENKDDKEYRHAYADENLNATIATQIKVLREQRGMSQDSLAREAGMRQSMISRYENVNYSSSSINTLRKLAKAFDVYLDVRFRSFREMVESVENFGREALEVSRFTEDPFFNMQEVSVAAEQGCAAQVKPGWTHGSYGTALDAHSKELTDQRAERLPSANNDLRSSIIEIFSGHLQVA